MRNKVSFCVTMVMIVGLAFVLIGCGTVTTSAAVGTTNEGIFGQQVRIPVKDFETVGLVFTENQYQITSRGAIAGDMFTFQELLKAAQRLGADAIINVVIDRRRESVSVGVATNQQETWYGSALAIKYTDVVSDQHTVLNNPHQFSARGSAQVTTEQPEAAGGVGGLFGRR